jgi:hypothetical protein
MWRASCQQVSQDGTCFTMQRVKLRHSCQESVMLPKLGKRKKKVAKRAVDALNRAVARYEQEKPEGAENEAANAELAYALAEHELEALLKLRGPRGLSFSSSKKNRRKKARSEERFTQFIKSISDGSKRAQAAFKRVISAPASKLSNPWRVAAFGQSFRVSRHFASLFYSMEIPVEVRSGRYSKDGVDAYCDSLAAAAGLLEDASRSRVGSCKEKTADLSESERQAACESTPEVIGSFGDARVTRRIFRKISDEAATCYADAIKETPGLKGWETLEVQVDGKGRVKSAKSTGNSLVLSVCIEASARTLVFPSPAAGDNRTLRHELYFEPES